MAHHRTAWAALAGALALASPATAQEVESLQQVTVQPYFAEGRLQGCALNFDVAQRDDIYAAGAAVGVSGSFQVYNFGDGRFLALLKVGVVDLGGSYQAPESAYLINGYATSAGEAVTDDMPSETEGFGLFGFSLGEQTTAAIIGLMDPERSSLHISRSAGAAAFLLKWT